MLECVLRAGETCAELPWASECLYKGIKHHFQFSPQKTGCSIKMPVEGLLRAGKTVCGLPRPQNTLRAWPELISSHIQTAWVPDLHISLSVAIDISGGSGNVTLSDTEAPPVYNMFLYYFYVILSCWALPLLTSILVVIHALRHYKKAL